MKAGVVVCLATGKARPAAFDALTPVGLAGTHRQLLHPLENHLQQVLSYACVFNFSTYQVTPAASLFRA